jgi:NADPH:quinone reductase-like Zn-dependent oxidoreductase
MKAAVIHGPDQAPRFEDFAEPVPDPGEELVRVLAAALHPLARSHARADHYASQGGFPAIVGVDGVGERADGTAIYFGWVKPPYGTFAERAATRGGFPLPAGLDPVRAAGMANPAASSWLALHHRAVMQPGETVMVVGATGSSGRLAIQIARRLGAARVIAVGRRREALQGVGADAAIAVDERDALVAEFARGVDIILDYAWGPPAHAVFAAIMAVRPDRRLRYVSIGQIAGDASFPPAVLRAVPIELYGSGMGAVSQAQIMREIPRILAALPELKLPLDPMPLREIEAAWRREGGDRIVIVPDA